MSSNSYAMKVECLKLEEFEIGKEELGEKNGVGAQKNRPQASYFFKWNCLLQFLFLFFYFYF